MVEYIVRTDKPERLNELLHLQGIPHYEVTRLRTHGRLIDADALKKHMTDLLRHDYVFDEVGCFGLVKDAPTLLEANT